MFSDFLVYFQLHAFAKTSPADVRSSYMYVCIQVYSETYVIVTTYTHPVSGSSPQVSNLLKPQLGQQKSLSSHPHASSSRDTDNREDDTTKQKEFLLAALKKYV